MYFTLKASTEEITQRKSACITDPQLKSPCNTALEYVVWLSEEALLGRICCRGFDGDNGAKVFFTNVAFLCWGIRVERNTSIIGIKISLFIY